MKSLINEFPIKYYRDEKIEIKINELKENFNGMSIEINKKKKLQQLEQAVKEKQELLAEEQTTNPSEPSPVSYFYNDDYDNISTPSTTYTIHLTKSATIITNPSEPTR
ncbi:hypothetical protein Tco_1388631, partial [Tanacetum coccineum]